MDEQTGFFLNCVYVFIASLAFVSVILLVFFSLVPENCGKDNQCFFKAANKCKSANYKIDTDKFLISVTSKDCTIKKTVLFVSGEPEPLRQAFVGKQMTCTYARKKLNQSIVEGLNYDDTCSGELVDMLKKFRQS